jgi:predicted acetyltransferase
MNESSNPEGVSFEQYMLIRYDEKRILGMISFKNYPDGDNYGHIGYTVRPSERNHGYAKGMLRLCLDAKRADRKFTLGKVLITCEKSNLASRSVILSCGGVYEGDMETRGGITLERYWIFL